VSELHHFVGSAKLIALLTLLSRVAGVIREMAFSRAFGTAPLLGAFRLAFQLPNLARKLFGEGALTSSFIPVFARTLQHEGEEAAKRLAGGVLTLLTAVLTALLVLIELAVLAAGWFTWTPAVRLSLILMPYMVLICVAGLCSGVLNGLNRFAAPALAPVVLNVLMILAIWFGGERIGLDPEQHMNVVAASVLIGGVAQLGLQVAWLKAVRFLPRLNLNWGAPDVRRIVWLIAPLTLGVSVLQLNTFVDAVIAHFLVPDRRGLAVLGYSQYMSNLPLGVFATAIATAIFPLLAQRSAARDEAGLCRAVETGLSTSLFITVPASVGLILVAEPLVRLLFESGEFRPGDTARVATSLGCYCLGIWAYALSQVLVRVFYALGDNRAPIRAAAIVVAANLVLSGALVLTPLRESGVALATSAAGVLQVALLAGGLRSRLAGLNLRGVWITGGKVAVATGAMAVPVWALRGWTGWPELAELTARIAVGVGVYAGVSRVLRIDELALVLRSRFRGAER
jgi:putative peptidoglycan lipid II flippase